MRLIDADKMVTNELVAFILAQAKTNNAANRDINSIVHEKIQRLIADTPTVEDNDVAEQCPDCGNDVRLKWDVERDGYTIYCPYCGYRMKLCSMCDVRDGGKCDWNSDTGKCKNDKNGRTTETAEPQPDGIQFRTVDDLGRICIPKDIRDKLGIKPGAECAVYATDELTSEQIIVIRSKKNEKTPERGTRAAPHAIVAR